VEACRSHPATFAYLVGNEISPEIVRWHGAKQVRAFLGSLFDAAKASDPDRFVSYANFPSTEYLDIDFADFLAFNVYLHREEDFRRYLSHLHNLAGDRPLVLTEIGIDSIGQGLAFQARALAWQLRASFETGVAGTVIFSWTDDWHAYSGADGFQVEDWKPLTGRSKIVTMVPCRRLSTRIPRSPWLSAFTTASEPSTRVWLR
jgi:O-antigen biosynthesis protein